ncbi:T9SS type A sorting domain-containing protein [bacterium]|nr:T9SS type A sorting domain-containing protein [bacterium]
MDLHPRDSTDTTSFQFNPWDYWGYYYTYDSLEYGETYVHRTYEGLDTYFAYTLNRDFPACREMVMAIGPAVVGDTHFVITSTLHWFTQALAASEPREQRPAERIAVYPNPFVEGFTYAGPRSRYRIFNILGQTVSEGCVDGLTRINLNSAPSGAYFLLLDDVGQQSLITVRKAR